MFIVPLSNTIAPVVGLESNLTTEKSESADTQASATTPFRDLFESLIDNAVETAEVANEDTMDVMLGDVDDLHTVTINAQKAATALELLVTVKNQAIAAYNDIIKMQL